MRLNVKLAKWAAAAVLSIGAAAPALGGSVTRPGDTIGLAVGVPLPEGLHIANNATEECRNTSPTATCYFVDTPIFVWSTPWKIFGARLLQEFIVSSSLMRFRINEHSTKSARHPGFYLGCGPETGPLNAWPASNNGSSGKRGEHLLDPLG